MSVRSWILALAPLLLDGPSTTRSPCPAGSALDPARAAVILARLPAQLGAPTGTICFVAAGDAGITRNGVLLLPSELGDIEAAARVAHLAQHRRSGSALLGPRRDNCERWLEEALDEEARAYALELAILESAGEGSRVPFAAEAMATPAEARVAVIRRWLHAHPGGGGDVPPLAASYAAWCREREDL